MSDKKVIIVGSGAAGMRAAYDISSAGIAVTLIESKTYTGGTLMQLEKQFPTDACGICRMQPRITGFPSAEFCLRKDFFIPGVEILRDTIIEKIDDSDDGSKSVTLRTKGLIVDPQKCIGCEKCTEICPIELDDEFSAGYMRRKAIDRASPHSIISLYSIDEQKCNRCGECVKICPTNAITLGEDTIKADKFGAVLLTFGFEEFIPDEMTEYGNDRFADVITSIELERLYAPMGPNFGKILRPSNGKTPDKIAFIQCVGSRMEERPYCSSACCMYSMKEARHLRKILPDAEIKIFFMDIRAFGKDYYRYEQDTEAKGIQFVRCRVPKVMRNEDTNEMELSYETENGERVKEKFDLVVLSIAQVVTPAVKKLADSIGIQTNEWGFAILPSPGSFETTTNNVFAAGSFVMPKDLADSVSEASAASAEILSRLGVDKGFLPKTIRGNPPLDGGVGIVLCKCAGVISDAIELSALQAKLEKSPKVKSITQIETLCTPAGLEEFEKFVRDGNFKSVVCAACQTNTYLVRFADVINSAMPNPPDLCIINVRRNLGMVANEKAEDFIGRQISMGITFATHGRKREYLYEIPSSKKPFKGALIIGAGLAGLSAAKFFADAGMPVTIIEKTDKIGGINIDGKGAVGNTTTGEYIQRLITDLKNFEKVNFLNSHTVQAIEGSAGAFKVRVKDNEGAFHSLEAGVIIVATGAKAYETGKFSAGKSPKIVLWDDFEKNILPTQSPKEVVFVQCADSRNDERPWCNRICCTKTMELANKLKDKNPDCRIWVLNRDIMTYGFSELKYAEARKRGTLFIRYTPQNEPIVELDVSEGLRVKSEELGVQSEELPTLAIPADVGSGNSSLITHHSSLLNGNPIVKAIDPLINAQIEIRPDYVVLQTGLIPEMERAIADFIPSTDGFWNGLDTKFSPQETFRAGLFVAGSGRMPMRADEAIADGRAAAGQAMKYLVVESLAERRRVAYVRERICVGCKFCIPACPYEARVYDYFTQKAKVNTEICQGCGACSVACPSEATVILGDDKNRIFAQISEAVK